MYMVSNWLVDGINNKLYKYTNDVIEAVYNIEISNSPIGEAAVAVGTDEATVMIVCPTAGVVAAFDIGTGIFTKYTTVGGTPMGICEGIPYGKNDTRPPYFVTNYDNDSVSIIKGGNVVQTIRVGNKPKSIATDGYGRIYVANYGANTVSVLALGDNDKYVLFKTITVDSFPNDIAINFNDDVFVTCKNTIYKIRKNNTTNRFVISGNPVGISADKYGNVWATNMSDNSIMKINLSEQIEAFVSGGTGPTYVSADITGDVICLNTGDKTLTRINEDGNVINTVQLGFTPMTNGDFIGMTSRINILDDISKKDENKVEWDDLSEEVQERIEQGVDPETLILKSDNITYSDMEGVTTVREALNKLAFEESGKLSNDIGEFSVEPSVVDAGATVNTLVFDYGIDNIEEDGIVSAEIDGGIGRVDVDGSTITVSGLSITEDTDFTITIVNEHGNVGKKTISLKFDSYIYYGINPNIITTSEQIVALDSVYVDDKGEDVYKKRLILSNGTGYFYIAVPAELGIGIDNIKVNGLSDSNFDVSTVIVRNGNVNKEYILFKSGYSHVLTDNSVTIDIEISR